MIIVLAVGLSAVALLGCLALIVISRLRRVIKSRFETIEQLLSTVRSAQDDEKPSR